MSDLAVIEHAYRWMPEEPLARVGDKPADKKVKKHITVGAGLQPLPASLEREADERLGSLRSHAQEYVDYEGRQCLVMKRRGNVVTIEIEDGIRKDVVK